MIEKVGYTRPSVTNRVGAKKQASASTGSSFIDLLDGFDNVANTAASEAPSAPAALSGTNILLGLQEVSEDETQQKKAFKQGKQAIDVLVTLRDNLLSGRMSPSLIKQLETIVAQERAKTSDPKLNAILDDIDVRVAVELAKLDRAGLNAQQQ